MDYLAGEVIALIRAHPDWAALIIGIVAFGESFVFLSLLFPGTAILIASGALVEAGILNPFLPVLAGILGAVLGDAISFWLGQKFGPQISNVWPFRHHPQRLKSGIIFFERYSTASVFIGRFFGPLRAVIPLAAGILHMPTQRFYIAPIGDNLGASPHFCRRPIGSLIGTGKPCDQDPFDNCPHSGLRRPCGDGSLLADSSVDDTS